MNYVDEAENHEIPADRGQSTAEQRNLLPNDSEPVGATVEQLTAEEKTIRQENSKQAAEKGSTQKNVLKLKKTGVSWVENKGYFTSLIRQRQFWLMDS